MNDKILVLFHAKLFRSATAPKGTVSKGAGHGGQGLWLTYHLCVSHGCFVALLHFALVHRLAGASRFRLGIWPCPETMVRICARG